ncbi:hypothetical protein COU89_00760 [Candidatus Roizmanbacteria bacterium CG10_big_fil_rev_8_21_14_0_10_45_7]|uniref:Uncharacterized protein n=1 Tax=Candidatus Roizmanbacteria bacterium CG10_big_fil_rev_8_21_14_0_10_45_7 TaxID=1974854 RepID=A0A2M8KVJ8_9BACT|nr:MAG: hypothetical protein COU89_00760 [Candidatus Roizmanbacteria bacterium CG10_big_fil_rev_8_21_14_0_10_45_7]
MQIGNAELDELYRGYIAPTLSAAGYEPKRVDKHNDGELLKPKITEFISEAGIIVADLTNERPNVYLEVGYTMGLGKYRNLILTCREDHYHGSPNYDSGKHRIHFDLNGYDILFWSPDKKKEFATELLKTIKRRTYITQPSNEVNFDEDWFTDHKSKSFKGLHNQGLSGYMEVMCSLDGAYGFNQIHLRDAAREAPISTFGWPIGAFMNSEPFKPRPVNDGIIAEIVTPESDWGKTYDYWAIRSNASFYLLQNLFEDTRGKQLIFFDTRIVRITETILYLARLYHQLKISITTPLHITIAHGGLSGRTIRAAGRRMIFLERTSTQDKVVTKIDTTVGELEAKLTDHVETITKDLFVLFDYFELERTILEDIVTNFVNGKIS